MSNPFELYEKRLYHSYKNEEMLPTVIGVTIFCCIFSLLIAFVPVLWILYGLYCYKNNLELDKNPDIQKQRIILKKFKEEQIKQEVNSNE